SATVQQGLQIDVTPIDIDGVAIRQGIVRITDDSTDGLTVGFYQYRDGDFEYVVLATNLDRNVDHHIETTMVFHPGADNDEVVVTIDGVSHSGLTSWEGYYADNALPTAGVDTIAFRVPSAAQPDL